MQELKELIIYFIGNDTFTSPIKEQEMQDFCQLFLEQIESLEFKGIDYEDKTIEFKSKNSNNNLNCSFSSTIKLDAELSGVFEFYPTIFCPSSLNPDFIGDSKLNFVIEKRDGETKLGFKLQRVRKTQDGIAFESIVNGIDGNATYTMQFFRDSQIFNVQREYLSKNPNGDLYSLHNVLIPLFLETAKQLSVSPVTKQISCRRMKRDNRGSNKYEVLIHNGAEKPYNEVIRTDSILVYLEDSMEDLMYGEYNLSRKIS